MLSRVKIVRFFSREDIKREATIEGVEYEDGNYHFKVLWGALKLPMQRGLGLWGRATLLGHLHNVYNVLRFYLL